LRFNKTNFIQLNATFNYMYKKLHYREEHSAYVVLSWCTLYSMNRVGE